jgi:OFA family oxalate/formate antiporter-like MFS transporter
MLKARSGAAAFVACSIAIFWPGAFIFGFPGVLGPYWQEAFEVGRAEVGKSLFFILAGAGSCMYVTGRWQERMGFPRVTALGAVICGGSVVLLGCARGMGAVYSWAFLVGASSAFIYIPALTVVQQWYPRHRGLVSGVVNMVFGLSAAVMSPLYPYLLSRMGYRAMTLALGVAATGMGLAAAVFIRRPRSHPSAEGVQTHAPAPPPSLTARQTLKTRAFWFLWLTWALAGAAGVAMVFLGTAFGVASGFAIQKAVMLQTAFNLTNGFGRLVSGYASDRWGRNGTLVCVFTLAGCAYILLPLSQAPAVSAVLTAAVGLAFGSLFAVSAPLAIDCFGLAHFGAIFGLIFTAYGFCSGILGPWLSGFLLDQTGGNFGLVFTYLGGLYFVAATLVWFVRPGRR